MTKETVLKIMQDWTGAWCEADGDSEFRPCIECARECDQKDTLKIAIECIKKQIPTKVVDGHHCPSCGVGLVTEHIIADEYKEICRCCFDPKCCPECGQVLDWSEINIRVNKS